ncbi:MAG: hypothetical protein IPH82_10565, partial [Chloroflexi bacterium]|nr:hypothetical protein [Chloroflexota bacterium]
MTAARAAAVSYRQAITRPTGSSPRLMAAMASHGAYGAMADGLEALPAKDGYATVAIYSDGDV